MHDTMGDVLQHPHILQTQTGFITIIYSTKTTVFLQDCDINGSRIYIIFKQDVLNDIFVSIYLQIFYVHTFIDILLYMDMFILNIYLIYISYIYIYIYIYITPIPVSLRQLL